MRATYPVRVTTSAHAARNEMAFLEPLFERLERHRASPRPRPFVTLGYAQSIDGSIAARPARPVALSSEKAFAMAHLLRARHGGLLVGIDTVLADDPRLTVRLCEGENPQPIVLDSRLRMPENARLFSHPDRRPLLLTTAAASASRIARLEAHGASVRVLPADPLGRVDLGAALDALAAEGLSCLMVEGGATVIDSFLRARLVDYCVITVTPRLMFGGLKTMEGAGPAAPLSIVDCAYEVLDGDLVIHGTPGD
ncbi:MAG TPA: RibD family protein [Burkholderiales bacterium]